MKITNLRVNFTRFPTFDGESSSISNQDKYYAIERISVIGGCFCSGHAFKCLPIAGTTAGAITDNENIIHGGCACIHNTKGPHCEKCQDLYNDRPWSEAGGNYEEACQMCNCHGHSETCHLDNLIFENSKGFVNPHAPIYYLQSKKPSGGVCDNCQHNTDGRNCERCLPGYWGTATSQKGCEPCNCDSSGAVDNKCDSVTGQCNCKLHVKGRNCDIME